MARCQPPPQELPLPVSKEANPTLIPQVQSRCRLRKLAHTAPWTQGLDRGGHVTVRLSRVNRRVFFARILGGKMPRF